LAIPAVVFGQFGVSIAIGPPELLVSVQPLCPGDGYLWTPGYWAYDDSISDYYWVEGAWVQAPEVGFLWTPGYWGWGNGGYAFNEGYWGPTIGFYGGINYGFGYFGDGYGGGRWDHGHFFYNRSVNNVDISINHNVYNEKVEGSSEINRVSFNGGKGGIEAHANSAQEAAAHERHIPAVAIQAEHARTARANPEMRASVSRGNPTTAGAPKAAAETSRSDLRSGASDPRQAVHPKDLPAISRPAPVNSGNAKADARYEQQQDKLISQQTNERQQLQQKQEAEHQQNANAAQTQELEQKHQQQTQQLQEKHTSQQQQLVSRQPQPKGRR